MDESPLHRNTQAAQNSFATFVHFGPELNGSPASQDTGVTIGEKKGNNQGASLRSTATTWTNSHLFDAADCRLCL